MDDIWNLYFHDPFDKNWKHDSYALISTIYSLEDFNENIKNLNINDNITKGMFFFIRDGIFPSWDDPSNINGGCISLKILKSDLRELILPMLEDLFNDNLLKTNYTKYNLMINGISISPKKQFCIAKIWISDPIISDINMYKIPSIYGNTPVMYKSNIESVSENTL